MSIIYFTVQVLGMNEYTSRREHISISPKVRNNEESIAQPTYFHKLE